eukprot:SAG25_NODE_298_length_10188_cov_5.941421_2_plen_96_part_00
MPGGGAGLRRVLRLSGWWLHGQPNDQGAPSGLRLDGRERPGAPAAGQRLVPHQMEGRGRRGGRVGSGVTSVRAHGVVCSWSGMLGRRARSAARRT